MFMLNKLFESESESITSGLMHMKGARGKRAMSIF